MTSLRSPTRGFSLIELLAAVAIVGLLASIGIPLAETTAKRSKEAELRLALKQIRGAVDAYKGAVMAGRITSDPQKSGYPPTLAELSTGVEDVSRPGEKLYFLRRIPRDPMQLDPSISAIDSWGKRSFDSPPDRPREGQDVFDVYSLSTERGLNGVPYAEW
jgi:general secretion pathway protein G